ncbi:transmembrane protein 198 isoform X2 [Heterocephalus glaber]|uniref:Transmembrane protein 198 n=1 Tax=Heterocephalus glaber TaxID=10181 RepID=A0AAX6RTA0_HETGA|nr:transmembrane protein 198 isoform X2 [Heterocephalus glaber]
MPGTMETLRFQLLPPEPDDAFWGAPCERPLERRYQALPALVCIMCCLFGVVYCFFGYRCFKAVLFLTGLLFGSVVIFLLCYRERVLETQLSAGASAGIALGIGLLCGLVAMLWRVTTERDSHTEVVISRQRRRVQLMRIRQQEERKEKRRKKRPPRAPQRGPRAPPRPGPPDPAYRRRPVPIKRFNGDVLSPSYIQSFRDRQTGSSLSSFMASPTDADYEYGSRGPLTACSGPPGKLQHPSPWSPGLCKATSLTAVAMEGGGGVLPWAELQGCEGGGLKCTVHVWCLSCHLGHLMLLSFPHTLLYLFYKCAKLCGLCQEWWLSVAGTSMGQAGSTVAPGPCVTYYKGSRQDLSSHSTAQQGDEL